MPSSSDNVMVMESSSTTALSASIWIPKEANINKSGICFFSVIAFTSSWYELLSATFLLGFGVSGNSSASAKSLQLIYP